MRAHWWIGVGLSVVLTGPAAAQPAKRRGPVLHVVAVGVARYRDTRLNLRYADIDAVEFAQAVSDQAPPPFQQVTRTVLVNRYATATNVRRLLERLVQEAGPEDTVVLFFSGHGGVADKGSYFFVTYEADVEHVAETTLAWDDVGKSVRALRARHLYIFIDSCNAGGTLGGLSAASAKLAEGLSKRSNTMVFCSSRGDENSIELPKAKHGAFTEALLEALGGRADLDDGENSKDGRITLAELREYVPKRVSELSKGVQNPRQPVYGGCDPTTVFAIVPRPDSKLAPAVPAESLLPDAEPAEPDAAGP